MTTNMAAPVDRQRLGRRGPLAAEHGTTSWPKWLPAMEQSCQGSKARSSCKIHFLIKLTHMTPSRPQWNAWAEKKASTETGAKSVSHCPIPPFSSEPGSSQDARTRTKTRRTPTFKDEGRVFLCQSISYLSINQNILTSVLFTTHLHQKTIWLNFTI